MSLAPGTRLGPYEVLAALGAGGMGEVYKARDSRLDRLVAVKVLSPAMAISSDARQRFERDARAISRLSHPHVCALFDVGREGDTLYLVMELLDGETLEALVAKGPLPMSEVLRIGGEIAEALAAASREGITHRDLKPGNVMLTRSGVKLLDFGLAKTLAPAGGTAGAAELPTAGDLTAPGMWLGTAPDWLRHRRHAEAPGAGLRRGRNHLHRPEPERLLRHLEPKRRDPVWNGRGRRPLSRVHCWRRCRGLREARSFTR
jgi:serine/threonine protein kinase